VPAFVEKPPVRTVVVKNTRFQLRAHQNDALGHRRQVRVRQAASAPVYALLLFYVLQQSEKNATRSRRCGCGDQGAATTYGPLTVIVRN